MMNQKGKSNNKTYIPVMDYKEPSKKGGDLSG